MLLSGTSKKNKGRGKGRREMDLTTRKTGVNDFELGPQGGMCGRSRRWTLAMPVRYFNSSYVLRVYGFTFVHLYAYFAYLHRVWESLNL
jgi:hypothetical protein